MPEMIAAPRPVSLRILAFPFATSNRTGVCVARHRLRSPVSNSSRRQKVFCSCKVCKSQACPWQKLYQYLRTGHSSQLTAPNVTSACVFVACRSGDPRTLPATVVASKKKNRQWKNFSSRREWVKSGCKTPFVQTKQQKCSVRVSACLCADKMLCV